jgi:phospholipid/cholesterol/gamma-HCH transport system ATP-binding protein
MLYDEPTTGLDPITTYYIDELIVALRKETSVTSLLVSHDVTSVMRVADRIAFLHEGCLVFYGNPDQFCKSDHPAIRELVDKSSATSFTEA